MVYYMQRLDTFNAPVTAINLAILVCLFYDFGLIYLYSVVLKFCFVNKKTTKTEHTSFQSLNFSYTGTEDKNWNNSSHNFDCAFSVAPPEEIYIIRPLSALWDRGHNRKWGEGGKGTPKFQGREVLDSMRKIINCLHSLVV